jgi:ADP-ribosylglycohydrolase
MPLTQRHIPADYAERVYAGVLGKIIGVYLGRPFENWHYDRIMRELGEINYYVHEKRGTSLIVTDDDITGTFTFIRALEDYGYDPDLTPAQIGQTWLNYIIQDRTILWWGGLGMSTEHTAYLRLKSGLSAPASGSIQTNGRLVAEQIGAQIFIDGWAMVAPGDPERAADLARRAASVSHDGEAVYAAQLIAAMESAAFVDSDLNRLIDTGLACIPRGSLIARLVADLREVRAKVSDWRVARQFLEDHYGYDQYGGGCHVIPNHGVIIMGLLYGDDDFQRTLMIVNTAGWDTDCNSGNAGCLMGIKNGLAGIDAGPDWRGPVADRLYLPTADCGSAITDAVTTAHHLIQAGYALAGRAGDYHRPAARYHFGFPGAVQGFMAENPAQAEIANVPNPDGNGRCLRIETGDLRMDQARICTATFIPPEAAQLRGYDLIAAPTLYPGQTLRAAILADAGNAAPAECALCISVYSTEDALRPIHAETVRIDPGERRELTWRVPETGGQPIAEVGIALGTADATVYLEWLTWDDRADVVLQRPPDAGSMWRKAWAHGVSSTHEADEPFHIIQNEGRGLSITGGRDWRDYAVRAEIQPQLCAEAGIAVRVQGMRRFYALLLRPGGRAALIKALDGDTKLAEAPFAWEFQGRYDLRLEAVGSRLRAWIDDRMLFDVTDADGPLDSGGIALIVSEGRLLSGDVTVTPGGD